MAIRFMPQELQNVVREVTTLMSDDFDAAEQVQRMLRLNWGWDVSLTLARDFVEAVR